MADAPNANDELYPIAVLIDELKVWRPRATTATHMSSYVAMDNTANIYILA